MEAEEAQKGWSRGWDWGLEVPSGLEPEGELAVWTRPLGRRVPGLCPRHGSRRSYLGPVCRPAGVFPVVPVADSVSLGVRSAVSSCPVRVISASRNRIVSVATVVGTVVLRLFL